MVHPRVAGLRAARCCAAHGSTRSSGAAERVRARRLIAEYERMVEELLGALDRDDWAHAVAAASVAETIRGFGPVRMESAAEANARLARLLEEFHAARSGIAAA